jgi:hypothetical protein
MGLPEELTAMGTALQIAGVPGSAQPGQPIRAGLAPEFEVLRYTDVVPQQVSLNFIAKQVVFSDRNFNDPGFVTDPDIAKVLPLFNLASVPPALDNSGVPGLVGRLSGELPVALPVEAWPRLEITWRVRDDAGVDLVEGTHFLAPGGMSNPTLDVTFLPAFARFDGAVPPPAGRRISASVTLSAGPTASWSGEIGPVRVVVPTIPFPKVLALTVDPDFQGPALVAVPDSSAINGIDHIRTLLQPVRDVITTLTTVAALADMLMGINTLEAVLNATNIVFVKANPLNNLNDITLVARPWYENNTEAEDELSAFVYISPPPPPGSTENSVEMFNARDLGTSEGKITVTTGSAFVAMCRDLHSATPAVVPGSAVLTVNDPPNGWRWFGNITTFGDEISSIRFL